MNPEILKRMIYNVLYVHLESGVCKEVTANDLLVNAIKRSKTIQILNITKLGRK